MGNQEMLARLRTVKLRGKNIAEVQELAVPGIFAPVEEARTGNRLVVDHEPENADGDVTGEGQSSSVSPCPCHPRLIFSHSFKEQKLLFILEPFARLRLASVPIQFKFN